MTPSTDRDRFVDLVRVAAIVVVVVGHWATSTIVWEPGYVASVNALAEIPATRLVTWVVQVMPLVFFAGGFANAVSLARAGSALGYLQTRMIRLLTPTAVFLGIWLVLGMVIEITDPTGPGKVRAAETAALPLWFLGIYVVAVGAAPLMLRAHRRFGWWVPGVLAAGVLIVDVVSIGFGLEGVGGLNYALVWLGIHQMGFFYADGRLRVSPAAGAAAAGAGLAALVVLTVAAGYPVSLVGVPGEPRSNAQPPSLAMVAGAVWLVGLALWARPALSRWLSGRAWPVVSRAHGFLLTLYLWHVTALMVTAGVWHGAGWPEPPIGSGSWWALRIPWVAAGAVPLAAVAWVMGRFEIHPQSRATAAAGAAGVGVALGVFSVAVALLGFGETGFLPLAPVEGEAVLMFDFNPVQNVVHLVLGATLLAVAGRPVGRWAAPVAGGAVFLALGSAYPAGWVSRLGMNDAGAIAHAAVGVLALLGVAAAALSRRRPGRPPAA